MKKRLLALFLCFVLTVSLLPTAALAENSAEIPEAGEVQGIEDTALEGDAVSGEEEIPEEEPSEAETPEEEAQETDAPEEGTSEGDEPEETEEPEETGESEETEQPAQEDDESADTALADEAAVPEVLSDEEPVKYNIWICEEQFTSDNLTIACGDGTATLTPATDFDPAVLTLENATIEGYNPEEYAAIYGYDDLKIVLEGENTVTVKRVPSDDGVMSVSAIYVDGSSGGNVEISGCGSLSVTIDGEYTKDITSDGFGIYADRTITIDEATVSLDLAFEVQEPSKYGTDIYGIYSSYGTVVIKNGANVELKAYGNDNVTALNGLYSGKSGPNFTGGGTLVKVSVSSESDKTKLTGIYVNAGGTFDNTMSVANGATVIADISCNSESGEAETRRFALELGSNSYHEGKLIVVDGTLKGGKTADSLSPVEGTVSDGYITYSKDKTDELQYIEITTAKASVDLALDGSGTSADPYLVKNLADLENLRDYVNIGESCAGRFFKMTADIELPEGWVPIGSVALGFSGPGIGGQYMWPFSGCFDGDGHLLTIPEDGLPLFRYVREADIKNLEIFGTKIAGAGLVNEYTIDYGPSGSYGSVKKTVYIDSVTLKSGSSTLYSGLVHGNASGVNEVRITNSTVEDNVVIGYGGSTSNIGSFIGSLNGTVSNCTSAATVKGYMRVGGLVGGKDQSMGDCVIRSSSFTGTVESTYQQAGGIIGGGYTSNDAPNAPCVTIENCYVNADITAPDVAGGIIGCENVYQAWSNGIGSIKDNVFCGTINCDKRAGAIVGLMRSLNKYNEIEGNYYCGTDKAFGVVSFVDTSNESRTVVDGTQYFDTSSDSLDDINKNIVGTNRPTRVYYTNHNRTDDPLGADAEKLAKAATPEQMTDGTVLSWLQESSPYKNWAQGEKSPILSSDVPVLAELTLSGDYKKTYYIGEEFDPTGMVFTAVWSNGAKTNPTLGDGEDNVKITGFDSGKQAVITLTATYGAVKTEFKVNIHIKPVSSEEANRITVSFTLLGDVIHDTDKDGQGIPTANGGPHTLVQNNLQAWVPQKDVTVDINATVWDMIQQALEGTGITCRNGSGNYIQGITKDGKELAEFTNGKTSGWMYTLNGEHPKLGVSEQFMKDGDVIVLHYTDDYNEERGSEEWTRPGTSGGTTTNPEDKVETTLNPEVEVNDKGEANALISEDALNNTIADAKTEQADVIVISPEVKGEASKVSVELPKSGVDNIAKQTNADLKVETGIADIIIPQESLNGLAKQSGSRVTISAEAVKDTDNVKLEIAVGGKAVEKLSGGITVSVPAKAENSGNVLVIVNSDGSETIVKKSVVDGKNVKAALDGSCTVKVVDNSKHFDDTANHWSKDAVAFASSHELFSGVTANTFAPDTPMSRAMLATVLYRLEDAAASGSNAFADVPEGAWYTVAVTWASSAGIVTGTGSGFDPDGNVTREQLATMLYRYAKTLGMDTAASGDLSRFSDGGKTSSWAKDAMEWAVGSGLISGKGSDVLDPTGSATRAEVAVIMQRLISLMVK